MLTEDAVAVSKDRHVWIAATNPKFDTIHDDQEANGLVPGSAV
jgi:hypothetical protein